MEYSLKQCVRVVGHEDLDSLKNDYDLNLVAKALWNAIRIRLVAADEENGLPKDTEGYVIQVKVGSFGFRKLSIINS
jgi:hypothetical protein